MNNYIVVREDTGLIDDPDHEGNQIWSELGTFTVIFRYQADAPETFQGKANYDTNLYHVMEVPNEWIHDLIKVTGKDPWVFEYDNDIIDDIKNRIKQQVNVKYESENVKNYVFTFGNDSTAIFQATTDIGLGSLAILCGKTSIEWTDVSNDRKTFTATEFKRFAKELFDRGQENFMKKRTLKDALDDMEISDLINYDIEAQWT